MRPSLRRPQVWQTDYTSEKLLELDGVAEGNDLREAVEDFRGLIVRAVIIGKARLSVAAVSPDAGIGEDDFVILLEAVLEAYAAAVAVAGRNGEIHRAVRYRALVKDVASEDAPLFAELMLDTNTVTPTGFPVLWV